MNVQNIVCQIFMCVCVCVSMLSSRCMQQCPVDYTCMLIKYFTPSTNTQDFCLFLILLKSHVIGSKHSVYFAQDKIKGADIVGNTNHMTSLTNRLPKLISLPTSTIFVLGTSELGFYFQGFFVSRPFKKI